MLQDKRVLYAGGSVTDSHMVNQTIFVNAIELIDAANNAGVNN